MTRIAVLVGSLRKDSFTRKVARALEPFMPELTFDHVELGDLPLYNQDLDPDHVPEQWKRFRDHVRGSAGYLFATPEYNRSVPGCLKNAIDVGSRPYGQSAFAGGKPGAVVSVSPGAIGGFGANHHLRQSLTFLDVSVLQQPEMYINNAAKLIDAEHKVTDDNVKQLFEKFGKAFTAWVTKHKQS
ncbi:MAG TPA: NAD(P)H-dependent oxidoreductase [Kofleriaceae bacterium]